MLDLSTGINPEPYPFAPLDPACFTRLPEPDALWALQKAAAQAYRASDAAMVVAAPGTQALISLLPRLWPQRSVAVLGPTYGEHEASWREAGASVQLCPDFSALGSARAAVVVNPNNPDGRRWAPDRLLQLAASLDLLVVDEAFADLEEPQLSLVPLLPAENTVVLRSFGKTYGLPGVRLGFTIAAPARAATIRAALGPWPVSGAAIQIGTEALGDGEWLARTRARQEQAAARLDALLLAAGCSVLGGTRLFRLAGSRAAPELFEHLGRSGIYVRAFATNSAWLRFGVPAPAGWTRLQDALTGVRFGP